MKREDADQRLVEEFWQAREAVRPAPNLSQFSVDLTPERAYQVGRALHERLVAQGFAPIGRQIRCTNRSMWERFKVSEPIWAHVYAQTIHFAEAGHARVAPDGMVAPRLEPEIVLKLRSPVPSGEVSIEDLARCIEWAAVGFEIVD